MVAAPPPTESLDLASMAMYGFGAIPTIGSSESTGNGDSYSSRGQDNRSHSCAAATTDSESDRPLKKRLRPRGTRN